MQCVALKRMISDLNLDHRIKVVVGDTVRETDGLAMSSRNTYLSKEERELAPILYYALDLARQAYANSETHSSDVLKNLVFDILADSKAYLAYIRSAQQQQPPRPKLRVTHHQHGAPAGIDVAYSATTIAAQSITATAESTLTATTATVTQAVAQQQQPQQQHSPETAATTTPVVTPPPTAHKIEKLVQKPPTEATLEQELCKEAASHHHHGHHPPHSTTPTLRPQYVSVADGTTGNEIAHDAAVPQGAILSAAVFLGSTRLIDNVVLSPHHS
eukprot:TRINITY_DN3344_c0_g2_i1.p1 TRINITY_DN3344_c0_g2~~TRINITY_DN3344_c0_g2_i1.p1  ORF type:complete len:273 (+),score=72.97 TRINITY_DN3344_c0_g2_i1:127-945(+)